MNHWLVGRLVCCWVNWSIIGQSVVGQPAICFRRSVGRSLFGHWVSRSVGCWSVGWSVLVSRSLGQLVGWLVIGQLVGRWVSQSVGQWVSQVSQSVGLVGLSLDQLGQSLVCRSVAWSLGQSVSWSVG